MSALAPAPHPEGSPAAPPAAPALPSPAPEPGDELFQGWTLRARVIGDRVIAKATCPADGRVLSSGPQPTRGHAFDALRVQITAALDCD